MTKTDTSHQDYKEYWIERYPEDRRWYVVGSDPTGGWSVPFSTLKAAKEYIDEHPRKAAQHLG